MGCCIAVALVIALVRRGWFRLFPNRAPEPVTFAPVAFRAAPGQTAPRAAAPTRVVADGSRVSTALGAGAVTTALYAAVVEVLRWRDVTEPMGHALASWTVRDVLVALVGIGAVVLAAVLYRGPVADSMSAVLTGFGIAWLGLGVLDMHVLMLFDLANGSFVADALFHGPAVVAILVGAALYLRPAPTPQRRITAPVRLGKASTS